MNVEKIGNYIFEKRKLKNMTQKELAEKLGLTDRAISRWERGLGCPDISILELLATTLEVSVIEILHGEDINSQENQDKIVVDILDKSKKKYHFWRFITLFLLNVLLVIQSGFFYIIYVVPRNIERNPNYKLYNIISTSMNPTLKVYDAVVVKNVEIEDISVGDIITYKSNSYDNYGLIITHRVINKYLKNDSNEIILETKGDNNLVKDNEYINKDNLLGVVTKKIPLIGHFILKTNYQKIKIFWLIENISILVLDIIIIKGIPKNKLL